MVSISPQNFQMTLMIILHFIICTQSADFYNLQYIFASIWLKNIKK